MSATAVAAILQLAISLLTIVQTNPSISQAQRDQATQVANQAISAVLAYNAANGTASPTAPTTPTQDSGYYTRTGLVPTTSTSVVSATIDSSSLTSTSANPVITGTARNATIVALKVLGSNGVVAGYNDGRPGQVGSDGRWSSQLSALPVGTYTVQVFANTSDEVAGKNLLTAGTLTVKPAITTAPSITLTYPTGGEQILYNTGKDVDTRIYWTASNFSNIVQIFLVSTSGSQCVLGSASASTGNLAVTLAPNKPCSNGGTFGGAGQYKVVVSGDDPNQGVRATSGYVTFTPYSIAASAPSISSITNSVSIPSGGSAPVTIYGTNLGNVTSVNIYNSDGTLYTTGSGLSVSSNQLTFRLYSSFAVGMAGNSGTYTARAVSPSGTSNSSPQFTVSIPTVVTTATPSCTISARPNPATFYGPVTLSWTSQNATYAQFVPDTSGKDTVYLPSDKLSASGSQIITASVIGNPTIQLRVTGVNGSNTCNTTFNVPQPVNSVPATPSATIDSGSLVASISAPFTLTGTAANTSTVRVQIGNGTYGNSTVSVSGGRWSAFENGIIPSGSYSVFVYDTNGNLLSSNNLTLNGAQQTTPTPSTAQSAPSGPPPAPALITASCSDSSHVILTWSSVSGATTYHPRISAPTSSQCTSFGWQVYSDGTTCYPNPDAWTSTTVFSFPVTPDQTYSAWVNSQNASGWSAAAASTSFTCSSLGVNNSQSQLANALTATEQLYGAQPAPASPVSTAAASCVNLSHNLVVTSTDTQTSGDVSSLQKFLGITPSGYFGSLTRQTLEKWQMSHSVVSSGTPSTTGYGAVGPMTRAAMACH